MIADMGRREKWQQVLDAEMARWSALSWEELLAKLDDPRSKEWRLGPFTWRVGKHVETYEKRVDATTYQVEVELLEKTDRYVRVRVGVDDGSLPASLSPTTKTFVREKSSKTAQ
jgi:hypothetical protein